MTGSHGSRIISAFQGNMPVVAIPLMTYAHTTIANADSLTSLERIILSKEPVPLSWVVKHGAAFEHEIAYGEIRSVLLIAVHVVPRQRIAAGVVSVVRTVLDKAVGPGPLRAIEAMEDWIAGRIGKQEVHERSAGARSDNGNYRMAGFQESNIGWAAANAALVAWSSAPLPAAIAANSAISQVINASCSGKKKPARKIRKMMRDHIHMTMEDVILAGKNGWNPK